MSQKYLDECAMKAMQSILLSGDESSISDVGKASYIIAQEMLKAKEKYGKLTKAAPRAKKRVQRQEEVSKDT